MVNLKPSTLDLSSQDNTKQQFETLYPLLKKYLKQSDLNYVNLTGVYDGCQYCYIDWVHVSPNAHKILVNAIVEAVGD